MQWEKKGIIYRPSGLDDWRHNSALNPTPLLMEDRIRIYCGFRDKEGVSRIGYVDVNKENPSELLYVTLHPVLDIGEAGTFDDNGVVPTAVVENGPEIYLYYAGYQLHTKIRMTIFAGLAISTDGGNTFIRYKTVPVMDRTDKENFFRIIHSVIIEEGQWKTYYSGGGQYKQGKDKSLPVYSIRCVVSNDGLHFPDEYVELIKPLANEYRVARSQAMKRDDKYIMFFSAGGEEVVYQLAYAESPDGWQWERKDKVLGIGLSADGWDNEMMSSQYVIEANGRVFMFYIGNRFGYDGFGWAELISD